MANPRSQLPAQPPQPQRSQSTPDLLSLDHLSAEVSLSSSPPTFGFFGLSHAKKAVLLESCPIPQLPVLNNLYEKVKQQANAPHFENFIFVCGQHLLDTTASLIQWIIKLGAKPSNIFIVGKSYSNCDEVILWLKKMGVQYIPNSSQTKLGSFVKTYNRDIDNMWRNVSDCVTDLLAKDALEGIIVVDDGGHVLESLPQDIQEKCDRIVGIEQTSSGVASAQETQYSTIQLASSAIKGLIEPPMIADRVADKLAKKLIEIQEGNISENAFHEEKSKVSSRNEIINFYSDIKAKNAPLCYGIIGYGHIGKAILVKLILSGAKEFIVFDLDGSKAKEINALKKQDPTLRISFVKDDAALIANADIVIGCTGKDVTQNLDCFAVSRHPKILISCSSKDSEFLTLLLDIQRKSRGKKLNPLSDIGFKNGFETPLLVVKGGMPVNFDNSLQSVSGHDIQIIRGLKAQAILQAYSMIMDWCDLDAAPAPKTYQLNPKAQLDTFYEWIKDPKATERYYRPYLSVLTEEYIKEHSAGEVYRPPTPGVVVGLSSFKI